jgi:hypothetical protein
MNILKILFVQNEIFIEVFFSCAFVLESNDRRFLYGKVGKIK